MAIDPLTSSLLRNPNFRGPIRKDDDIKKRTDEGWFTRPGDPYQYKMAGDGMIAFRNPATGEVGQFNSNRTPFSDPENARHFGDLLNPQPNQFLNGSELAGAVAGNSALLNAPPQRAQPAPTSSPQANVQAPTTLNTPEQAQAKADGGMGAAIIQALQTPAVQQALVQFGGAVGGPDSPAGRFAEPAGQLVDTMAEGRMLAGLMSGRDPGELEQELVGISPQARERAFTLFREGEEAELAEREQVRRETATAAQIEQGARRLDLAESAFNLDVEKFELAQTSEEFDQWATEQKLKIDQQTANSLAQLRQAQSELAGMRAQAEKQEASDPAQRYLSMQRVAGAMNVSFNVTSDLQKDIDLLDSRRQYMLTKQGRKDLGLSKDQAQREAQALQETIDAMRTKKAEFQQSLDALNSDLQSLTSEQSVPVVQNAADLEALPSGAEFIGPDGKRRVKK